MKTTSLVSALALFALCTSFNVQAASQPAATDRLTGEVPIHQIAAKVCANGDFVTAGTSRIMVSARLGSPDAVLRDGSWLYSGYTLTVGTTVLNEPRMLVVRFTRDSAVSSLTLADHATVVALRQMSHSPAKDQFLAAVQKR
jgi:hypothetical protein